MKINFLCKSKSEKMGWQSINLEIHHNKYWCYEFEVSTDDENVNTWGQLPIGKMELLWVHTDQALFDVGATYSFDVDSSNPIKRVEYTVK